MLLNELHSYFHYYKIFPYLYTNPNCFQCNQPDSYFHWLTCNNSFLIHNIIQNTIHNILQKSKLELSNLELQELEHKLANHQAFSTFQPSPNLYYIETILKGLIPIPIIQSIQSFNISYKIASTTIIQILLDINEQIYDQIWIPYCCNFSTWRKNQNIPIHNPYTNNRQTNNHHSKSYKYKNYTYSCICSQPDELHTSFSTCPPIGQAIRKIDIWSTFKAKFSTSTNYILTIQI